MPKKDQAPDPVLGPVLRQLRDARGEAREALAYRAGLTAGTLAEIELGRANPSWATVMQIIDALDIPLAKLSKAIEAARK